MVDKPQDPFDELINEMNNATSPSFSEQEEGRRNFRTHPITTEELNHCRWYAVVDDLIGGYNISNVNQPASMSNPYEGEFEIGCFMTKETAEHVAAIHNAWWDDVVWDSYFDNIKHTLDNEEFSYHYPDEVFPVAIINWRDQDEVPD